MEGLAIGNGLAEVVCGTIIITISLYLQFSVGRKAVGKRVLVDQYLFPMAFVLTGLLLFGRAVCIGNGWLKVSALLATLSAPIVGMLLFLPTFGWLSASGRHRKCHWGWLLVEALALDAIVVVRRASGVEMWATMYCLLAGILWHIPVWLPSGRCSRRLRADIGRLPARCVVGWRWRGWASTFSLCYRLFLTLQLSCRWLR